MGNQLIETEDGAFFHPSAIVDPGARVGKGTKIWHFVHVQDTAEIGEGCIIGQGCYIAGKIGNGVKIQNGVNVFQGVILEDDVFVGPAAQFTNILEPRSARPNKRYVETRVRRGATIGANATIVCGNEIGENAMVGAGAVVTKNVPPNVVVVGNPARVMREVPPPPQS